MQWFDSHNPFAVTDLRLHSLSSGVVAGDCDGVNCDDAEVVGSGIMKKMDELPFNDVVLTKADGAITLANVVSKNDFGRKLSIDSAILFNRLIVIMQRSVILKLSSCMSLQQCLVLYSRMAA